MQRTILCLAAIFFWAAHDPNVASGQSSELMEAYNSFNTLYQQGRYLPDKGRCAIYRTDLGPDSCW